MSSQKEFIVGCLIGGVLGTLGALTLPKRYLNGIERLHPRAKKKQTLQNGHVRHAIIAKRAVAKKSIKRKVH
jgi:gas vesicle protein